jgi:hypothetical protein
MGVGYRQDQVDLFAQKQRAFMNRDSEVRGQSIQIKALVAIDAGGAEGVAMGDVHRALMGARLAPQVIRLVIDRLEAMGHIYREEIRTGGRPRIQMWSFRNVAKLPKESLQYRVRMSYLMTNVLKEDSRPEWERYQRDDLLVDILRRTGGDLNIKDIEVAACQLYAGSSSELVRLLFRSEPSRRQRLHFLDTLVYRGLITKAGEACAMRRESQRNTPRYAWSSQGAYQD